MLKASQSESSRFVISGCSASIFQSHADAFSRIQEPDTINPLLTSIQTISDVAQKTLSSTSLSRADQLSELNRLIDQNHQHLVSLGVGHAALEAVRSKTREEPWKLSTKLTGAGGGGCAVTILPDGEYGASRSLRDRLLTSSLVPTDFSTESLTSLKQALTTSGFVPYSTVVGGRGFGVHLPSSSTSSVRVEEAEGGAELSGVPEGKKMAETRKEELGRWAQGLGDWLYV